MKYLIDTHTAIWFIQGDLSLSDKSKKVLLNSENEIYYSIISLWEIAIKLNINRIKLTDKFSIFRDYLDKLNFIKIGLKNIHFDYYVNLPIYKNHRDPFDRMIISQSITENLPIISADTKFDLYPEIKEFGKCNLCG